MIYLFFTGGSGNRGCEAIVRGTLQVLKEKNIVVYSAKLDEEEKCRLNQIVECRTLCNNHTKVKQCFSHVICWFSYHLGNQKLQVKQIYSNFLSCVSKEDTYLVIGGDVYCYDRPRIYYRINEILKNNKKIMWGCSIEPDNIDNEMKRDLLSYDMIYARESITYEELRKHGIKDNVKLCPDPAFKMQKKEVALPLGFRENNTIGINVSPLIMGLEKNSGITRKNYEKLIEYILDNTECSIALIPHVIWDNSDDRKPLCELYNKYSSTNRIILIEALFAEEVKYVISKCRFLIAARTHASIAAYSTCVPTLVVGYSVKARGIAKDIFGEYEHYTIPVQELKKEDDLTKAFEWIWNNEYMIRKYLDKFIPQYIKKLENIDIDF